MFSIECFLVFTKRSIYFKLYSTFIIMTCLSTIDLGFSNPTGSGNRRGLQSIFGGRCDLKKSELLLPNLHKYCCSKQAYSHKATNKNSNQHSDNSIKVTVFCAKISEVPLNLPRETTSLIFDHTNIQNLTSKSFESKQLGQVIAFELSNDNSLTNIGEKAFSNLKHLQTIDLRNLISLTFIAESAFYNLTSLRIVMIRETGLKTIQGFTELGLIPEEHFLEITISKNKFLSKVQKHAFFNVSSRVAKLDITSNPSLTSIEDYAFNASGISSLSLSKNRALTHLSTFSFSGIEKLEELYIDQTSIKSLPTAGLDNLRKLNVSDVPNLLRFPRLSNLNEAYLTYQYHCCALGKEYGFRVTYKNEEVNSPVLYNCDTGEKVQEKEKYEEKDDLIEPENEENNNFLFNDSNILPSEYLTEFSLFGSYYDSNHFENYLYNNSSFETEIYDHDVENSWKEYSSNFSALQQSYMCTKEINGTLKPYIHYSQVFCYPEPDKFSPCENLLGNTLLTVLSWIVALLAVTGNFFVVFTLFMITMYHYCSQQRHLTVQKFLILNLAFADLCMGIYIFALAVMDRKSTGNYYKFGIEWQTKGGCDTFGFLAIFASQLSVYTLTVISLERWYAIRYAIRLDKRMTLLSSQIVMLVGWFVSILFAALPLKGINSYQKTAICLPMDTKKTSGKLYAGTLLFLNLAAFIMVLVSYIWMYALVRTANVQKNVIVKLFRFQQKRGSDDFKARNQSVSSDVCCGTIEPTSDARIAKKMAVLVFTNFACFFPITFCALLAITGHSVLTLSQSKFLLVFCLPLNACANPFLYAILTRSFMKDVGDLVRLLKSKCLRSDGRQRATSRKFTTKKFFQNSEKRQECRKTLQIPLDPDAEVFHPEGSITTDHKSNSSNTKMTYLRLNTTSTDLNSQSNSVSNRSSISKGSGRKNSVKKRDFFNSVGSSAPIEEFQSKNKFFIRFSELVRRTFKTDGMTRTNRSRLEFEAPNFEIRLAATTYDGKNENVLEDEVFFDIPVQETLSNNVNDIGSETLKCAENLKETLL